jgi:hypothetical protein
MKDRIIYHPDFRAPRCRGIVEHDPQPAGASSRPRVDTNHPTGGNQCRARAGPCGVTGRVFAFISAQETLPETALFSRPCEVCPASAASVAPPRAVPPIRPFL